MNLPTIIIAWIIAVVFAVILISEIRKRKKGGGCSCGCSDCAMSEICHKTDDK